MQAWELSILFDFLELEYWSVGVMDRGLMSFYPTLQYSITPMLQGRSPRKLLANLLLPFY
jgi:hypothetical protein